MSENDFDSSALVLGKLDRTGTHLLKTLFKPESAPNLEARTVVIAAFGAESGSYLCIKRLMLAQYLPAAK